MEKKISGVYKIENLITGDFYIGSSKEVKKRWYNHKCPSAWKHLPNSQLYKDMQKYGVENFEFTILCEVEPEQLTVMEQKMIKELCPTYNNYNAKGWDVERQKESQKKYQQSGKYKEYKRKYRQSDKYKCNDKKIKSRKCLYEGKILTFNALCKRLMREGIQNYYQEAKRYIIQDEQIQ